MLLSFIGEIFIQTISAPFYFIAELTGLLKTPLIPAGFSGKHPTKTGSLIMPGIKGIR